MEVAAVSLHGIATRWMSDGVLAWQGLVVELTLGALYIRASRRPSPRGSRWSGYRTLAFLAGLGVVAVALQSGVAAYDDVFWVHNVQHVLLMMLGPLLLALGAPVTLALRTASPIWRARVLRVLHDPAVRAATARPGVLLFDYNVTMAAYLLTPLYRLSIEHPGIHILVHAYFLLCGLLFWLPIAGVDPVPGRLAARTRILLAGLAVPVNAATAALLLVRSAPAWGSSHDATTTGALALLVAGSIASAAGVVLVAVRARKRRALATGRASGAIWVPTSPL